MSYYRAFLELTCVLTGQLQIHLVAQILNGRPIVVFDFPNEIDQVRSAPPLRASASSLPGIFTVTGTKYSARFS